LYIANRFWPSIRWLDFVVWSPRNFTVDTYVFDTEYYFKYYAPRELKYYFGLYLPTLAERVLYLAQQISDSRFPAKQFVRQALVKLFVMPAVAPPPETQPPPPETQPPQPLIEEDPLLDAALAELNFPAAFSL
jgi:hypothetical protein